MTLMLGSLLSAILRAAFGVTDTGLHPTAQAQLCGVTPAENTAPETFTLHLPSPCPKPERGPPDSFVLPKPLAGTLPSTAAPQLRLYFIRLFAASAKCPSHQSCCGGPDASV